MRGNAPLASEAPLKAWHAHRPGRRPACLRGDHGATLDVRLARLGFRSCDFVFVGAVDDISADRRDCWTVENRSKVRHAVKLQEAVENDVVKSVHGQVDGFAQIRDHPAAHRLIAVADATELGE